MARPSKIYIDHQALTHNIQRVQQYAPNSQLVSVIKANAYGHGLVHIAKILQADTDLFAVAAIEEAMVLREAGIIKPILLLEGIFSADEASLVEQYQLIPVIHHSEQLTMLEKSALSQPISAWLKINIGMCRLGIAPSELSKCVQRITLCPYIENQPVIMGHFPNADDLSDPLTKKQIQLFNQHVNGYKTKLSLANSAAIIAWPNAHQDYVRPGIMLYGASPIKNKTASDYDLKPVMTFSSKIMAIRHCQKGDAIGYGGDYICKADKRIGVIAVGYGDGYPRHVPNGTPVLINKKIAPIVGRVSMDMITVDLTDHPTAEIGTEVILWGKGLPVEIIAEQAGTISYELLCQVTDRVR